MDVTSEFDLIFVHKDIEKKDADGEQRSVWKADKGHCPRELFEGFCWSP